MTPRLPSVRHRGSETRSFIPEDPVKATSTTETPLPEHNGPEKPGRWHAPKEPRCLCSLASQAGHLAFAHFASGGCAPADVLGRWSDTSSTNTMDDPTTTAREQGDDQSADLVAATLRCRYEAATRKTQDVGGGPPARSVVAAYLTGVEVRSTPTRPPARARPGAEPCSTVVSNAATTLRAGGFPTQSCGSLVAAPALRALREGSRSGNGVAA